MYGVFVYYIKKGGKERGMLKGGKTSGWWVLRNQQWSGVPTLVKGDKGRVVWYEMVTCCMKWSHF